jgi:hypothetical protein
MGVLNKLKGRMSGPRKSGEVYGFSTGKERDSGVATVSMGLAAGQAQQAPVQAPAGQDVHDGLAAIGAGLAAASDGKNLRKESITKSKEDGKTGKEAREIWKKERAAKKAKEKAEKAKEKAKKKSKKVEKEINKGDIPKGKSIYYNSATDLFRFGDHEE